MISAADLQRWGVAGLPVEEPEPIILPPPNFAGDQVKFERRDESGVTQGHMYRDHVEAERAAGIDIRIVDEHESLPEPARDRRALLLAVIDNALADSDHYFLADRHDVDEAKKQSWTDYRSALRGAKQMSELAAVMAALPKQNPKGLDPFVDFRTQPES